MIRALLNFIHRLARPWTVFMLGAAALALVFTVNVADLSWTLPGFRHLTHGVGILDMEWHYFADGAYRMLAAQGEVGRARYLQLLWTVDVALPLLVSLWLAMSMALALRRLGRSGRLAGLLTFMPVAAGLSDYIENSGISFLLVYYPHRLDVLAGILGHVTSIKHMLYALSVAAAVLLRLVVLIREQIPGILPSSTRR